ncbi:hypothetical protein COV06_03275 [Candidatus Uhrbacteria bacterium CG10_big_fil_rev_8_21_14_0_10_50_16]|uniref:FAD/NAD(P)-binding domain-containing protein n=1 Tax=Candidatus Uhrbacteria bacterium CG10_big_fil_rev_8_21_14_0_10_50_16 TaxID=1975039 RepID=A0A2H0RN90_9BACT|nr:MAG: hypothetical protein COV06_03275 [Candidatus Uhrbacteria bacterium CG10_big_fil_rev_8_21_14_0_10_50_16]
MTHYLIIGGGIAGTSAAEQLRKLDPTSEITILSNEDHPLYSRVLLPHYITGKTPRERVFLKTPDWYQTQNIHLAIQEVQHIHPQTKTVTTTSGATYTYTKLLIAGGGITRHLPWPGEEHVLHFQTIEDADRIKEFLDDHTSAGLKAGLIGGGFIAMEFAELFANKSWSTHLFLRGTTFFSHTFDQASSDLLEEHLTAHNITVHKNMSLASYNGAIAKTEDNGTFPFDVLAAGVGISSQFSWASDAGVTVGTGVKTNEFLETNVTDIYAAGDCTEYMDTIVNRQVHIGNWMNAQMQGRHVAKVMTGERAPFELVSSYATHVLGIDIVAIGDANIVHAEQVLARDYGDGRTLLFVRGDRVVGASLLKHNTDRAPIIALIKSKQRLCELSRPLSDTTIDLREF